ncbi:MAG: carboxypeptidase-like regulatory domain-containing protein, partial [Syntrophales bacterium]|nr:carboxypeptidase-like regulatory domain-containing protein [Syntrophales bacterium]
MVVTTIDTIRFFNWVYDQQTQTNNKEYITQIDRATQGSFPVSIEAVDAFGDIWDIMPSFHTGLRSPLTISSSNPAIVYVQQSAWGPEFHALAAGSANIVVTSSDGMQATLPVTVTIGETTPQVAISVFPSEVSSNYTGDISFSAISNYPLSQVGTSTQGFSNFSSNYSDNGSWGTGNLSYSSTFQLVNQEPDNFTVMFYASTSDGTTSITARTPLRITADPSLAALKGDVCILDDLWAENFTLEFYDLAGTKVFERDIFMMHQVDFQLAGIPAGDYKLRLVFGEDAAITQWYPNAGNFAGAQTVTFAAGGTVEDVYFFLSQGPTISFSGTVRGSDVNSPVDGTPVVGASVYSTDDWNVYTSTDGSGAFTLTGLPVNSPFDLEITATGFVTTYSQTFNTADDIAGLWPFVMFTSTELAGWPIAIMPAGTGFITGRVVDAANPSLPLAGVTVSYTSGSGGTYNVAYFDGTTFYSGETATTSANGLYYIYGIQPGDAVSVQATKDGWTFNGPAFRSIHSDSVHEGLILGSASTPSSGISFTGSVVQSDGVTAAGGARVELAGNPGIYTTTAADGTFT